MNDMSMMPSPLVFSDSAADKVKALIVEEGNEDLKLRVFVTGGGCSGLQYGMKLENEKADDDWELEVEGVKVLVDAMTFPMIDNVTVDFVDTLTHTGFKFDNPNASAQCTCGSSFSV
mgnify:CR=1 FL=1